MKSLLSSLSSLLESFAMAARNSYESNKNRQAHLWCDHCRRPHHTKATCRKLHGKPTNWVPRNQQNSDGKGFQVTKKSKTIGSSGEETPFSKDQLNHLSKLLSPSTLLPTSSSHVAKSGTALSSITYPDEKGESWIINFGASDHMIGNI